MADVAAKAGVSLSTVSLAYSGAGPISPEMKARVERAAEELDYAGPSAQARALRQIKSAAGVSEAQNEDGRTKLKAIHGLLQQLAAEETKVA